MHPKLLLFDIDGTLLIPHGIGRRLLEEVLSDMVGRPISSRNISFSGKTDPQILHEILLCNQVSHAEAMCYIPRALETYVLRATTEMQPDDVTILPGVLSLLQCLSAENGIQLALLTGNHRTTAYLKLQAIDLAHFFPFGAFGSDHADRLRLPAIAVRRASQYSGYSYEDQNVVIIGDSTLDIACGRSAGAFCVAVCTGLTSRSELAAHSPDLLLADFTDTEYFCHHILQ